MIKVYKKHLKKIGYHGKEENERRVCSAEQSRSRNSGCAANVLYHHDIQAV